MDLLAVELAMDSWLWDSWLRNLGYESPGCGLLGPDGGASTARGGVGRPNLRDPENIETKSARTPTSQALFGELPPNKMGGGQPQEP